MLPTSVRNNRLVIHLELAVRKRIEEIVLEPQMAKISLLTRRVQDEKLVAFAARRWPESVFGEAKHLFDVAFANGNGRHGYRSCDLNLAKFNLDRFGDLR